MKRKGTEGIGCVPQSTGIVNITGVVATCTPVGSDQAGCIKWDLTVTGTTTSKLRCSRATNPNV